PEREADGARERRVDDGEQDRRADAAPKRGDRPRRELLRRALRVRRKHARPAPAVAAIVRVVHARGPRLRSAYMRPTPAATKSTPTTSSTEIALRRAPAIASAIS